MGVAIPYTSVMKDSRRVWQKGMAQHFLLTADACTMSLGDICTMSDRDVEDAFARLRWSQNNGQPYCPHCGSIKVYTARRKNGSLRFRCQGCRKDFSITSGTIFAWHKMPLRIYLLAIVIVCNEVKGKSMLALRRDLRVQYKTAFVLAHKISEATATEVAQIKVGGPGKV